MATTPVVFENFGGLTLRGDPEQVGAAQALDLLNVTFAQNGTLSTRDGYSTVFAGAGPTNMAPQSGGFVLASFSGNSVKSIDLNGISATVSTGFASQVASFASTGTAVYYTDGPSVQVKKFTGGAFSTPAGLAAVTGRYLAVQPLDNRLVIAGLSRVKFSDPGAPETVGVNNFVDLTPGDGEEITGMVVFGTDLFVFKKSKFFVFYGNSTDADGNPVFNYRMIDTGIGCWQAPGDNWMLVATHRTGVYFVARDGVYRTLGGEPVRVSDQIAPVFKGANLTIPPTFTALTTPVQGWGNLAVSAGSLTQTGADPRYWYFTPGSTTSVSGFPVSSRSVRLVYWKTSPTLSANGDTPLSPARWHHVIVDIADRNTSRNKKDFASAEALQATIDRKLSLMRTDLLYRQTAGPAQVLPSGWDDF